MYIKQRGKVENLSGKILNPPKSPWEELLGIQKDNKVKVKSLSDV